MSIRYAGVDLLEPTDSVREWARRQNDPAHLWQFNERQWPGRGLAHLPFRGPKSEQPIEFNVLWFPTSASRFACFHGLVDQGLLDAIRKVVYPEDNPNLYVSATLSLRDGYSLPLETQMFMLPAMPIQQTGVDGWYLLTLVDERYFWFIQAAAIAVDEGVTTWADVYEAIEDALGITITVDAIEAAYLKPPASMGTSYENLPTLLDAVAYCTGRRIVRQLDGTVRAWNPVAAKTQQDISLATTADYVARLRYSLSTAGLDNTSLLPESVTLVFPRTDSGAPSLIPHVEPVTLASLALADFSGVIGFIGSKVFKPSLIADYPGPSNAAEITALSRRFATDWYRWQAGKACLSLVGYPGWTLTGLDDALECRHEAGQVRTRILRDTFNDAREELAYLGAAGSIPPPPPYFSLTVEGVPDGAVVLNVIDLQLLTPTFIVAEIAPGVARVSPHFGTTPQVQPVGTANDAGTSPLLARVDHVHAAQAHCNRVRRINGPPPWTPPADVCCDEKFWDGTYEGNWDCDTGLFAYFCQCYPETTGSGTGTGTGSGSGICYCTQCLHGSPTDWYIPTPNASGDFAALGDGITISWTGADCTWSATKGNVTCTLSYIGPLWRLRFVNNSTGSYNHFHNHDPFRCCGENDFRLTRGEFTPPTGGVGVVDDDLTLEPASLCIPCGGGGGPVTVPCCPGVPLLDTYYFTYHDCTGACACLNHTSVPLVWDGSLWRNTTFTGCGSQVSDLGLECLVDGFHFSDHGSNCWQFSATSPTGAVVCDPLGMTFETTGAFATCCGSGGTVTLKGTISE